MRLMSEVVPSSTLTVYSRPGCHLCEEALASLDRVLAERGRAGLPQPGVEVVDIEGDAELLRRYVETIPVLHLGSAELPLATSEAGIRRFLAATLDAPSASAAAPNLNVSSA